MQITYRGKTLWITYVSGYVKPVLLIGNDNHFLKIASFNDEESAKDLIHCLSDWLGIAVSENEIKLEKF